MLPHPLTNFEIQKYYQNEIRFNGVYSRNIVTIVVVPTRAVQIKDI